MDLNSAESLHDIELLITQLDKQLARPTKSPSTPVIPKKLANSKENVTIKVEDRLRQAGVIYTRKKQEIM